MGWTDLKKKREWSKEWRKKNAERLRRCSREYYAANREKLREHSRKSSKKYYDANRDEVLARKAVWRAENRDWLAAWKAKNSGRRRAVARKNEQRRYATDPQFRLIKNSRSRALCLLRCAPVSGSMTSALREAFGCSIGGVLRHVEAQWLPGMTWDNWSRDGWHIDHIRPLASFDLTDPEQFKQAWHYTNLQPLWAKDNLRKHAKWEEDAA